MQKDKLKKCSQAIVKDSTALVELMKVFEGDVAEYLLGPTKKKVLLVTKEAEMVVADLHMSEAPEWEGSFKELMEKVNTAKSQLQATTKSVKVYADEAKAASEA